MITLGRSWIIFFFFDLIQKFIILWSGWFKSHDPDQKSGCFFFDPDQKSGCFFLIRIKNWCDFFWSGSKIRLIFFDLDQNSSWFFLIRIKNRRDFFWSGSKIVVIFFDPNQKSVWFFLIQIKNKNPFDFIFFYPVQNFLYFFGSN